MILRHLLVSSVVLALAGPALAQEARDEQGQAQRAPQAQIAPDAHHLIGKKAVNAQGKEMGKVKDVLVGPDGRVQGVVLDYKRKNHAVAWDQVQMRGEQITINMSEQQLSQLPEYKMEKD